ncbi:response regulator [Oscillospiraceae bacterium HV4-5-C5C]|nr:response regulator [Oscillospiraceae bacterium HV4-5-C5C]
MYQILIVDDEPVISMAIGSIINTKSDIYHVIASRESGTAALTFVDTYSVDIIITDLKMPEMNGIELIEQLRSGGYTGMILVMSNYSDFNLVHDALLAGANDYILKVNVNESTLFAYLDAATKRYSQTIRAKNSEEDKLSESRAIQTSDTTTINHSMKTALLYSLLNVQKELPLNQAETLWSDYPYMLFYIVFSQNGADLQNIQLGIQSIIYSIFNNNSQLDIYHFESTDYFCMVPAKSVSGSSSQKALQIQRQTKLYLNLDCLILYCDSVSDQEALKCQYKRIISLKSLLAFYQADELIIDSLKTYATHLNTKFSYRDYSQLIDHIFKKSGKAGISKVVDRFSIFARNQYVEPQDIRNLAFHIIQTLVLVSAAILTPEEQLRHTDLLSCHNIATLKEIFESLILHLISSDIGITYRGGNKYVSKTLDYIHLNYASKLTLDDIAAYIALDKTYLCRLFKKETGSSIFHCINTLRMQKAAELLRNGCAYLREVAISVGIDDPLYFTKQFKKYYGVSPSQYSTRERRGKQ